MSLIKQLMAESKGAEKILASFEALLDVGQRALEEPSVEVSTELFLMSVNGLMEKLGAVEEEEETPSLERRGDRATLESSVEGVKNTAQIMRTLIPRLNNNGRAECKQLADILSDYDNTYLSAAWLDDKESVDSLVTLGAYNAVFTRNGNVVEDVAAEVEEDVKEYRENIGKVKALNDKFCSTLGGTLDQANATQDDVEFLELMREALEELTGESTYPFTLWEGKDYPWMGSDDEGNPKPPSSFEKEQLRALSMEDAERLARCAADLSTLYCELVDNSLGLPCENTRGMLVQVQKRLKSLDYELCTQFYERLSFPGLRQDLSAPYMLMGTLMENLIRGIDAYLRASVVDKAEDSD